MQTIKFSNIKKRFPHVSEQNKQKLKIKKKIERHLVKKNSDATNVSRYNDVLQATFKLTLKIQLCFI